MAGIAKEMPNAKDLEAAWRSAKARAEIAKAVEEANRHAARWQDAPAPDGLADRVRVFLDQHPESSWDAALRKLAQEPTP